MCETGILSRLVSSRLVSSRLVSSRLIIQIFSSAYSECRRSVCVCVCVCVANECKKGKKVKLKNKRHIEEKKERKAHQNVQHMTQGTTVRAVVKTDGRSKKKKKQKRQLSVCSHYV